MAQPPPPRTTVQSKHDPTLLHSLETLTAGPFARVEYKEAGWLITNPAVTDHPGQELHVPNQVLCDMTNSPLLMEVFK